MISTTRIRTPAVVVLVVAASSLAGCGNGGRESLSSGQARQTIELPLLVDADADFTRPDSYVSVTRDVAGANPGQRFGAAVRELMRGPTAQERRRSMASPPFPADPGVLRSITLEGGTVVVDFSERLNGTVDLRSDLGGAAVVAPLLALMARLPDVEVIELRGEGRCETFAEWVGNDGCVRRTRADIDRWEELSAPPRQEPGSGAAHVGDQGPPEPRCGQSQPNCRG